MSDVAHTVRSLLVDPVKLCSGLGLIEGAKRQSSGLLIRCPAHSERTASCSVTLGGDGTIRVRCFGCDLAGDALTLIAAARDLSARRDFTEVAAVGAELAGHFGLASELRAGRPITDRPAPPKPKPSIARPWPPLADVLDLWSRALPVERDPDAWEALRARGLDPVAVAACGVARALPVDATVPRWARYRGGADVAQSWPDLGYRLILPMLDHWGKVRSVRAWRIEETRDAELPLAATYDDVRAAQAERDPLPKRLPPAGYRATGLVLANRLAVQMLRGIACPLRLVIAEGEPDFLTWCVESEDAVLGVISGSWSPGLAARIPTGTRVAVRTHQDDAGRKYGDEITESLKQRCSLWR